VSPFFEHHVPSAVDIGGATMRVFVGGDSPVTTFSPLLGAQLDLPPGLRLTLPLDASFEHGILLDTGALNVDGTHLPLAHLAYLAPGASSVELLAGPSGARIILLGGEPLGEQIIMWWNFIGRTHDEIVGYRDQWQREVIVGEAADGRFGHTSYDGRALPAPEMPTIRLKPRG
jgi:redox-sensitive bicupin YhaK (pirin superfamily)